MGRPTKLTSELQERLCGYVRDGQYLATAAALAGVHESTVHRWMQQGEPEDAPKAFRDFREALTRARAEAEAAMVEVVTLDAKGGTLLREVQRPDGSTERQWAPPNGKIALEYLARTQPTRWRPVKAVEVSGPDRGPVKLDHQEQVIENIIARVSAAKARRQVLDTAP
ncbi:hypothetical protein [Nonomuraea typhae]|uniref:Terminase small subunit n=1 Tax=Nonomuraea typhae TaxID=2603600 RepID=A0ABW7YL87_9ACTN